MKDESRAVRAGLRLPAPTARHHHAANTSPALVLSCTDPLRVTLTPKKLKTGIGSTVILSCALSGSPEYVIRWYRNTELVVVDDYISIRGISNETLLITAAQKSHSGAYQCFATRKSQTAQDFSIITLEGELASSGWGPAGGFLCPSPSCRIRGAHQGALCMDGGKQAPLHPAPGLCKLSASSSGTLGQVPKSGSCTDLSIPCPVLRSCLPRAGGVAGLCVFGAGMGTAEPGIPSSQNLLSTRCGGCG